MRKIGIVASRSSITNAYVILNEGEERNVKAEDLVLIENLNGNRILGVCRFGAGLDENLEVSGRYRPGVAYARMGMTPSDSKRHYTFKILVIADVTSTFEENRLIIAPGSDVYIFEDEDNPMELFARGANVVNKESITIGHYKGRKNWRVPINSEYISRHIWVTGMTGSGKSYLVKYELIPALRKVGYDILVFDWKGDDYVPHFEKLKSDSIVRLSDIALDDGVVVRYLLSKARYFGYASERDVAKSIMMALEQVIFELPWREKRLDELQSFLGERIKEKIRDYAGKWAEQMERRFESYWNRLTKEDFELIKGTMKPEKLLKLVKEKHVVVLDLSTGGSDEKLSVFLSIADYLGDLMTRERRTLDLALIIDEGPQYCPYSPKGLQEQITERIKNLCALGRAYRLALVIVSQGMAGAIGISPAVRRNLNTQFIGKLHPLDISEAEKLLGRQGVDIDLLTKLPVGHFYFLGSMNPSPIPLLISFKPDESRLAEALGGSSD